MADLPSLIEGCIQGLRKSQKALYEQFFGYAMKICICYSNDYEDAMEIVNTGFFKVFSKLETYNPKRSFKGWLRRIMINSAIDHYRKEIKYGFNHQDIDDREHISNRESAIDKMAHNEVIQQIQGLSPSYRTVFNLYVVDGYKHKEIAKMLNISEGTSKSNLARARMQLREALSRLSNGELV